MSDKSQAIAQTAKELALAAIAGCATFYLFTDGLADQFGGPNGKKFKYKQFEEMLLSISHKTMTEQANYIHQKFDDWKGNIEQVDDVCVIGVRV